MRTLKKWRWLYHEWLHDGIVKIAIDRGLEWRCVCGADLGKSELP